MENNWNIGDVLMTLGTGGMYGAMKLAAPSVYGLKAQFEAEKARKLGQVDTEQHQQQMGQVQDYIHGRLADEAEGPLPQGAIEQAMVERPGMAGAAMLQQPKFAQLGANMLQQARGAMKPNQFGGFNTMQDRIKFIADQSKQASTAMQPYRSALTMYDKTASMVNAVGGIENMTGAQDQALVKFAQKMILDSEAVMSDDQRTALQNSGMYNQMEAWAKQAFSKEGAGLGTGAREAIIQMMSQLRGSTMQNLEHERVRFETIAREGRIDPTKIFQRRKFGGTIQTRPTKKKTGPPTGAAPYTGQIIRDAD